MRGRIAGVVGALLVVLIVIIAVGWRAGWFSVPSRPQTPMEPLPYVERAIEFASHDGVRLAGSFAYPANGKAKAGVLLLGAAGPNDRDLGFAGHKAFAVWSDSLVRAGYAVLRTDDRGVGGSGGDWRQASYQVLAEDALTALDWMRNQPTLHEMPLGLLGLSEGAAIALMASAVDARPDFVVLLSPPGLPGRMALRSMLERTLQMHGVTGESAAAYYREFEHFLELSRQAANDPAAMPAFEAFLDGPGKALVPPYGFVPTSTPERAALFAGPWYQSQLDWDPQPHTGGWSLPVLVIGGDKDLVLPPDENHPPLEAQLGGHARFLRLDGVSHLLQPARTGWPQEYARISTTVDTRALDAAIRWLDATL